jgi:hypothetical protein
VPDRLLSLAAGTVLDLQPPDAVEIAAAAGFGAVGVWYDPDWWSAARAREVSRRLEATGLVALDIEPVILGREVDPGEGVVDAAAEIGARHVLVAGGLAEPSAVTERVPVLCVIALSMPAPRSSCWSSFRYFRSERSLSPLGSSSSGSTERSGSGRYAASCSVRRTPPICGGAATPSSLSASRGRAPENRPRRSTSCGRGVARATAAGRRRVALSSALDEVPGVLLSFELRSKALMTTHPNPSIEPGPSSLRAAAPAWNRTVRELPDRIDVRLCWWFEANSGRRPGAHGGLRGRDDAVGIEAMCAHERPDRCGSGDAAYASRHSGGPTPASASTSATALPSPPSM